MKCCDYGPQALELVLRTLEMALGLYLRLMQQVDE
jgi:hypothetical protein